MSMWRSIDLDAYCMCEQACWTLHTGIHAFRIDYIHLHFIYSMIHILDCYPGPIWISMSFCLWFCCWPVTAFICLFACLCCFFLFIFLLSRLSQVCNRLTIVNVFVDGVFICVQWLPQIGVIVYVNRFPCFISHSTSCMRSMCIVQANKIHFNRTANDTQSRTKSKADRENRRGEGKGGRLRKHL